MKKQIIQSIYSDNFSDTICSEYYKMSKEDLKTIICELSYSLYYNLSKKDYRNAMCDIAEELEERLI